MNRRNTRSTRRDRRRARTVAGQTVNPQDKYVKKTVAKVVENAQTASQAKAAVPVTTTTTTSYGTTTSSYRSLPPVSDEITPYGAKKFRNPMWKNEFVGTQGSPMEAVVLDIDGTLTEWGSSANQDTVKWTRNHVEKGRVILVITARDHGVSFTSSFNQLLKLLPFAFIGPFCRPDDDPRYASEFKRELVQGFEDAGLYKIVGAADDNNFVIDMWKHWAIEHFENPEDFDLLECSYRSYSSWRNDLPARESGKTVSYTGMGSKVTSATATSKTPAVASTATPPASKVEVKKTTPQRWVNGHRDGSTGDWIGGYWSSSVIESTSDVDDDSVIADVTWEQYLSQRPGKTAPDDDDIWTNDGYTLFRSDVLREVERVYPHMHPDEYEGKSNEELWEMAGYDYRQDLLDGVTEKFSNESDTLFSKSELESLCNDDLEELLNPHVNATDAAEYVDMILEARMDYDAWENMNSGLSAAVDDHQRKVQDLENMAEGYL